MFYVFYCILYFVIIRTTYGIGEHRLPVEETNPRQQHYGIELKPTLSHLYGTTPSASRTPRRFDCNLICVIRIMLLCKILDNLNLVTSSGTSHFCETEIEPFPYNVLVNFLLPQNRCRSLRIYVALRDRKAVQVYASMLVLFDVWVLCAFWICSAPLSRLTPIEALPQTPQGLCPLTPQAL